MTPGLRFIAPWVLCCAVGSAGAQVSIGIGLPNVSIGINLPVYPQLVRLPDYPVYYAPEVGAAARSHAHAEAKRNRRRPQTCAGGTRKGTEPAQRPGPR